MDEALSGCSAESESADLVLVAVIGSALVCVDAAGDCWCVSECECGCGACGWDFEVAE